MVSLTHDNIRFVAVARATDKAVVCSYVHRNPNSAVQNVNEYYDMLHKVLRAPTWKQQVLPNSRHTLECEENKFHFTMDEYERVFVAITVSDYPIRLAFKLIETIAKEMHQTMGNRILTCKEGGLDKESLKLLKSISIQFDDRTQVDKLANVLNQVDNVKITMQDNIQAVLASTEKMESVEQKTSELSEQAKIFRNSGKKLKRMMWLKNIKLMAVIAFVVILAIIILLAALGAFKKTASSVTSD